MDEEHNKDNLSSLSYFCYDSTDLNLQESYDKKQSRKEEKKYNAIKKELNTKSSLTQDDVVVPSEKFVDMVEVKTKKKIIDQTDKTVGEEFLENSNQKRRRGRPKKHETNKPQALIIESASNPIHKHPVDYGEFDFESSTKHKDSVLNEDNEDKNDIKLSDYTDESSGNSYESVIHIKDPRLWTFNDYIKNCHDAYMVDTIPFSEFRNLRRNCKASFCLPDPSHVFMGVSQKHDINFDSTLGGIDKWPNVKKLSEDKSSSDHFISTSDFNQNDSDNDSFSSILDSEYYKEIREQFSSFNGSDFSKPEKPIKFTQKKQKIQKSAKKREEIMKKTAKPVYKQDSLSYKILSVTRSIIDDPNTNPVYFGHENMNKFQRGLHDSRSLRLYTLFESPTGLVKNWDKYHMKIQTPKWERKSNTFSIGGYNHLIQEVGYDYMTRGICDESVNAGVDYVEHVLAKSDNTLTPMDKNETCTLLKESLRNTKILTQDFKIPDITNEIKNFCSNFAITFSENMLIKKNREGTSIPYFVKRKDAPLMSYSTGDLFTEMYSNTSYIEPCFDYPAERIVPNVDTSKKKGTKKIRKKKKYNTAR